MLGMEGRQEVRKGGRKGGRKENQRKTGLSPAFLLAPAMLCALSLDLHSACPFPPCGFLGVEGQEVGGRGQDPWT